MPQVVNITGFGRVNFPDGMSPEQIQSAIETDILPNKPIAPAAAASPVEKPNAWERVGRGSQDVVDRIAQLVVAGGEKLGKYQPGLGDVMTEQMNAENADYAANRGEEGFDGARLVGNAGMLAPTMILPGGAASLAGRAGAGALAGAVSGALQYDPSNSLEGTAKNTGMGAAVGAVAAPVIGFAGGKLAQGVSALHGRVMGVVERLKGNATPEAILRAVPELADVPEAARRDLITEAQAMVSKTGDLDAASLGRKANLTANDVTPTKSMVTRNPTDWARERNLQKLSQSPDEQLSRLGQELTDVYQANDRALSTRLASMSDGLPRATQEAQGMTVMKSINDLAKASQKEVGALYEQVKVAKGDQLASDARDLASTLEDLKDNTYAEKLVSSVTNKLRRFGMLDAEGNTTAKSLTVTQAEELRKFVNTLPNDFGKRDIIKAIDSDVLSGMGEDAFGEARKAAAGRFAMLDNPTTQRALNTYGELQQGKTAQGFIKSQVIDAPEQDVNTLLKTLSNLPADKQQESMKALQGGVLQHLEGKAVNRQSGQFSGAALSKEIERIGTGKLTAVLGPERFAKLKSLTRAGLDATYQPPYAAVNHSNTAPMLLSLTEKARAVPGVPLIVSQNVEKLAARSGYQDQLAEALSARAPGALPPQLSDRMQELARLLSTGAAPTGNAALNQLRQAPNQRNQERR